MLRLSKVWGEDLLHLSTRRDLALGGKDKSYSSFVHSVMLLGNKTWLVKKEHVIRLERNFTKMVRSLCNITSGDRISAVKRSVDKTEHQHGCTQQ